MKMTWMAFLAAGLLTPLASADVPPPEKDVQPLQTQQEKTSYVLGVDMARNLRRQGMEVDLNWMIKGLTDGLSGEKLLIPEADMRQTLATAQTELRLRLAGNRGKSVAEINKRRGELFLAENKVKDGAESGPASRLAVQNPEGRRRQEARGHRHGGM